MDILGRALLVLAFLQAFSLTPVEGAAATPPRIARHAGRGG